MATLTSTLALMLYTYWPGIVGGSLGALAAILVYLHENVRQHEDRLNELTNGVIRTNDRTQRVLRRTTKKLKEINQNMSYTTSEKSRELFEPAPIRRKNVNKRPKPSDTDSEEELYEDTTAEQARTTLDEVNNTNRSTHPDGLACQWCRDGHCYA